MPSPRPLPPPAAAPPSAWRRWEAVRRSALLLAAAVGLAALTALPSRCALWGEQEPGGTRWLTLAGGLLTDVALVGPVVTCAVVLLLWTSRRRGPALAFGLSVLFALLALSWLGHNAAMEFRIQRGVFPGPIEAREGLGHGDFVFAEVPSLLGGRYGRANLVCGALAVALGVLTRRQLVAMRSRAAPYLRVLVGLGLSLSVTVGLGARRASAFGAGMHNPSAFGSPARSLLGRWLGGTDYDGSPESVRVLLSTARGTAEERAIGAASMGFSELTAARLERAEGAADCTQHPLARPLLGEGTALLLAAREVSRELFRGRTFAPVVHHVSLESLRADDIHALAEEAPRELTPFLSRAYASETTAAAGFRHAHQSGVRTAQALSAVMCGYGALPFHLALGRDLGALPLRCAPDVLRDAGFRARAFYGHDLVFDDMGTFLHLRGLEPHERRHFPAGAPRGVWDGVADAAVYGAALDAAAGEERAQYNFVLTLSHHNPYTAPSDLPDAQREVARELCAARGLTGENCARLATLGYADHALGRFVAGVEAGPDAARSLVVFAADHTTHVWVPWGASPRPDGIDRIPFVVWLPEALRRGVVDAAAFAAAWERFRALAATQPVSNTDLPTLLLGLLEASPALASLPASARWHTLGGQATSTQFRSPTGVGAVFGIDAHAHPFDVTEAGVVRHAPTPMETLVSGADVAQASPLNRPMLAFWGSFLRGYAAACPRGGH